LNFRGWGARNRKAPNLIVLQRVKTMRAADSFSPGSLQYLGRCVKERLCSFTAFVNTVINQQGIETKRHTPWFLPQ
jgi:hypothetical protein